MGEVTRYRALPATVTILALAIGCASPGDRQASLDTGADNPAVDALFASWDTRDSPGCALAVARDGDLIYSRGYGYANLDYDIPITPQTVFDVASVTKQFVAAVANMLALAERSRSTTTFASGFRNCPSTNGRSPCGT